MIVRVFYFVRIALLQWSYICLLYTSDAADERSSVDLGGRRIIKKTQHIDSVVMSLWHTNKQHNNLYEDTMIKQ